MKFRNIVFYSIIKNVASVKLILKYENKYSIDTYTELTID